MACYPPGRWVELWTSIIGAALVAATLASPVAAKDKDKPKDDKPVHAGELVALKAESIELGGFRGIVYYTDEYDGYRVVATIAEGEAGLPVRFVATLAENQSITISVPGGLGILSRELKISRAGGKLIVSAGIPAGELGSAGPQTLGE